MAIFILDQDADRALDDVVKYIWLVTGVDDDTLVRIFPAMALFQKACNAGVDCTIGWQIANRECEWETLHAPVSENLLQSLVISAVLLAGR